MKKYIIGMILMMFLFIGCREQAEPMTEDQFANPLILEEFDYVGTFANGDHIYIDKYKYNVQDAAWRMVLVRNNSIVKLFEGMPSQPKFNKERTQIVYIDNLQFEAIGNVTIYDSMSEEEIKYSNFDYGLSQETMKDVEWYNEDTLLCIVGYGMGTITQGGDLYSLKLSTKELEKINLDDQKAQWTSQPCEIVDVYISEDNLILTLVEWSDDNYETYYYTMHHLEKSVVQEYIR